MRKLEKENIIDILVGATLLGAGGGGSLDDGLDALNNFEKNNAGKKLSLNLIDSSEMEESKFAATVAGMGSPLAFKGKDVSNHIVGAYSYLKEYLASSSKSIEIDYSLAVELGGFNTCIPMIIAMMEDIPLVDADGAGRAVPALETLLFNVNGCDTTPLCFSDGEGNKVLINLNDPKNAPLAEKLGRNICIGFDMMAGVAGWVMDKSSVQQKIANKSISLCESVGKLIKEYGKGQESIFDYLDNGQTICFGTITNLTTEIKEGFDVGNTIIEGNDGNTYEIKVINENITITKNNDLKPFLTAPDIIALYEQETGRPLTNADTFEGQKIVLGTIKALDEWFYNGEGHVSKCWRKYFDACDYDGDVIRLK